MTIDEQMRGVLAPQAQRILEKLKEPRGVIVARRISGIALISREILVITATTVSWGWPAEGHLICRNQGAKA